MSDFICQKYTDCSSCSHYQKQIFKYRSFPKGMMIPKERCSQNTIYFLISGSVRVTSDEHPDTVFHDGQFIMQPIGSRVEFHILESTECILYLFETPQNICTDRFNKGLELAKESPMLPVVMDMCFPLRLFINGLKMYLNNELLCVEFVVEVHFEPVDKKAQNVPQQRTPVCGIPESQADGVVFPAQLLLYIERDRLFLCTYI